MADEALQYRTTRRRRPERPAARAAGRLPGRMCRSRRPAGPRIASNAANPTINLNLNTGVSDMGGDMKEVSVTVRRGEGWGQDRVAVRAVTGRRVRHPQRARAGHAASARHLRPNYLLPYAREVIANLLTRAASAVPVAARQFPQALFNQAADAPNRPAAIARGCGELSQRRCPPRPRASTCVVPVRALGAPALQSSSRAYRAPLCAGAAIAAHARCPRPSTQQRALPAAKPSFRTRCSSNLISPQPCAPAPDTTHRSAQSRAAFAAAGNRACISGGDARISWATKGFELSTGLLPHEVVRQVLGENVPTAVVSGPTFAKEVGAGLPTGDDRRCERCDVRERSCGSDCRA